MTVLEQGVKLSGRHLPCECRKHWVWVPLPPKRKGNAFEFKCLWNAVWERNCIGCQRFNARICVRSQKMLLTELDQLQSRERERRNGSERLAPERPVARGTLSTKKGKFPRLARPGAPLSGHLAAPLY